MRIMELLDEWCAEARYAFAVAVPARAGEEYTCHGYMGSVDKAIQRTW